MYPVAGVDTQDPYGFDWSMTTIVLSVKENIQLNTSLVERVSNGITSFCKEDHLFDILLDGDQGGISLAHAVYKPINLTWF